MENKTYKEIINKFPNVVQIAFNPYTSWEEFALYNKILKEFETKVDWESRGCFGEWVTTPRLDIQLKENIKKTKDLVALLNEKEIFLGDEIKKQSDPNKIYYEQGDLRLINTENSLKNKDIYAWELNMRDSKFNLFDYARIIFLNKLDYKDSISF